MTVPRSRRRGWDPPPEGVWKIHVEGGLLGGPREVLGASSFGDLMELRTWRELDALKSQQTPFVLKLMRVSLP